MTEGLDMIKDMDQHLFDIKNKAEQASSIADITSTSYNIYVYLTLLTSYSVIYLSKAFVR